MDNNTHEVTVLAGTIDLSWRAHQEHVFYLAEETLAGTIILTPAAGIPARRKQAIPLREYPSARERGNHEETTPKKTPSVHPLPEEPSQTPV